MNEFRWEGGAGLGLLESEDWLETLKVKRDLKIRAEIQVAFDDFKEVDLGF